MKIKRLLALFLSIALVIGCTGQWTVRAEEAEAPALNPTLTQSTGTATAVPVETEVMETEDHPFLRYIDETQFLSAGHAARLPEEERLDTYVFLNRDGTKTVYHMGRNVKFVDTDGTVVDKDTTLVATDGGYTMRRNDVQLLLPEEASTGVFLALGDYGVRLVPQGGSGTAVMENNAVVFEDYYGEGMTLKYSPMLSGVKEDIILESYTGVSSFSFGLVGYGLGLYERDGAWCLAPSETAETVFTLGDVLVYDAIGKPVMGTMTAQEVRSGVYTVTISAPEEFLTDPMTVYPVTIDPTLQVRDTSTQTQIEDAPVFSNYPNSSFGTYVFNTIGDAGETYGIGRTAVRLKGLLSDETYQGLSADEIVKAEFYIRDGGSYYTDVNIYAITNNTTWTESNATWNNLTYNSSVCYATSLMGGGEWECFDITSLVKAWKNGTQNEQCGFMMVLADETKYVGTLSSEYGTGENWPYAVLTYNDNSVLNKTVLELFEGYSSTLIAQNPDNLALSWTSDNESVATVSSTGTVTGVNAGTTIIRVCSADNSINASCTVHVVINDGVYYVKNASSGQYLNNTGSQVTGENKDTGENTKFDQLWQITYVANGRYAIRPMDDTSKALKTDSSADVYVEETTKYNSLLTSDYLWTIRHNSTGYYFQQNGDASQTIVLQFVGNTSAIIYAANYSSGSNCHWTLELVAGIFLRDLSTKEIITPSTVIYMDIDETLSLSQLGITLDDPMTDYNPTWSSSNSEIATVDSNGTVTITGISPGETTITMTVIINRQGYSASFSVYVKPIPDGMYYISNNNLGYYVRIDSSASSNYSLPGTAMEISQLNAEDCCRWEIVHRENGYYSIISVESDLALTVPSDSLNSTSVLIIQEAYTALDSQKWTFSLLSDSTYVIRPKSAESYITDWCMAIASTGSMYSFYLGQSEYTENTSFLSEWNLCRIGDQVLLLGITDEGHDHSAALANSIANLSAFGYGSFNFTVTGSTTKSAVIADMTQCHFYASRSHGNHDNDGTYIGLGNGAYVHSRDIFNYSTNTALVDFSACDVMLFVACYTANHDNCLPDAAVKAGADYAIGFTESIGCDTANTWTMKFIEYYSLGFDVATSANRAVTDCGGKNNIDSCLVFQPVG